MSLSLRPAGPEDETATIALWRRCGLLVPWNDPAADFRQALACPTSAILLGEQAGDLLGSAMLGFDGHRGWVYYLAVAPERQRQGHGRQLIAAAEAWMRARGVPKINLMVRDSNTAALGFYRALGYADQPVATLGKRLDRSEPDD